VDLGGRIVRFHLSPEGKDALANLFPATVGFDAEVVETDTEGLWVLVAGEIETPLRVKLLKWGYFSTASVEYQKRDDSSEQ